MKINDLIIEILDIETALDYKRDFEIEKEIRNNLKNKGIKFVRLKAFVFEYKNIKYVVYFFSRDMHFEIHFFDGTNGTSEITGLIEVPMKVYSTVFRVLYDEYKNKGIGQSIWIAYDEKREKIYEKFIKKALKKYKMDEEYFDELKKGKTKEGFNCFIMKKRDKVNCPTAKDDWASFHNGKA